MSTAGVARSIADISRNLDKLVPAKLVSLPAGRRKPMTLASIVCKVLSSIGTEIIIVIIKHLPTLHEHL